MKALCCKILTPALIFAASQPIAEAQDRKAQFEACIDTGFANLVSDRSKDFSSPQYTVVCDPGEVVDAPPGCKKHDRDEVFTYEAPAGFRIEEARFKIAAQTARTNIGDLTRDGARASINLQCRARECGDKGHVWVSGQIVGHLVYQATAADAKTIAGGCLDQILQ